MTLDPAKITLTTKTQFGSATATTQGDKLAYPWTPAGGELLVVSTRLLVAALALVFVACSAPAVTPVPNTSGDPASTADPSASEPVTPTERPAPAGPPLAGPIEVSHPPSSMTGERTDGTSEGNGHWRGRRSGPRRLELQRARPGRRSTATATSLP